MRVGFVGSRGIPANYGGFETFVEELSLKLKENYGYEIYVVGDVEQEKTFKGMSDYKGIKLLYSSFNKGKAPNLFYLQSMLKLRKKVDVIYACGVGGAFVSVIPILLGEKVVVNPDGVGWEREKWAKWKKIILKAMFWVTAKVSTYIVNDSFGIQEIMKDKFGRKNRQITIEYGAEPNPYVDYVGNQERIQKTLERYNLEHKGYHLVVARLEPENNVETILEGYLLSKKGYPLIVVGNLKETSYVDKLKKLADKEDNIKLIGGVYGGDDLAIIRASARSYFHGHSVGGTNPSLLEAMGSKNLCVCHDNPFNRATVGEFGRYFSNYNEVAELIDWIDGGEQTEEIEKNRNGVYNKVIDYFNWDNIAARYNSFFKNLK